MSRLANVEKTDLKRGFCLLCLGFCWMILLWGVRVTKAYCQRKDTRYPLGIYPHTHLAPRPYPEVNLGASSHYLDKMMMADEKLFQMLRFAKRSNVFQTNSMKTCGLRFMKVWKITCDMVV